jgi:hypothetical protein
MNNLIKLVFILVLSAMFSVAVLAQSKKELLKVVVKKPEWNLDFLKHKKLYSQTFINIGEYPVQERRYQLPEKIETQFDSYLIDENNQLKIGLLDVWIFSFFSSYSLNEKVFGYGVAYKPLYTAEDGTKKPANGMTTVYFADEDGDGKFETRHSGFLTPMKIPDWVVANKK